MLQTAMEVFCYRVAKYIGSLCSCYEWCRCTLHLQQELVRMHDLVREKVMELPGIPWSCNSIEEAKDSHGEEVRTLNTGF